MWLAQAERLTGAIGMAAILLTLATMFWGLWLSLRRIPGRKTGIPERMMNRKFYLVGGTLYFGLCYVLWRPVPVELSWWPRAIALALGVPLLFTGLALVVWGRLSLGRMYNVSSGFGVQLYSDQRLITDGPFSLVRHPMYLGILLTALGGILIYRNWTFAFLLGNFPGLFLRARNEEETLSLEFGERWAEYARRVPAWIPRIRRLGDDRQEK